MSVDPVTGTIMGAVNTFAPFLANIGAKNRERKAVNRAFKDRDREINSGLGLSSQLYDKLISGSQGDLDSAYERLRQGSGTIGQMQNLGKSYQNQLNSSYFDTIEGKGLSNQIRNSATDSRRQLNDSASLLNLSDEAYIAGLGNINSGVANSMAQLATGADARRNNLRASLQGNLGNIFSGQRALANDYMNMGRFKSGLQGQAIGAGLGQYSGIGQNARIMQENRRQATLNALGESGDSGNNLLLSLMQQG